MSLYEDVDIRKSAAEFSDISQPQELMIITELMENIMDKENKFYAINLGRTLCVVKRTEIHIILQFKREYL